MSAVDNSVVIQEPGDHLTLTMEEDIDWSDQWKLCMTMREITPNSEMASGDEAEILLIMVINNVYNFYLTVTQTAYMYVY